MSSIMKLIFNKFQKLSLFSRPMAAIPRLRFDPFRRRRFVGWNRSWQLVKSFGNGIWRLSDLQPRGNHGTGGKAEASSSIWKSSYQFHIWPWSCNNLFDFDFDPKRIKQFFFNAENCPCTKKYIFAFTVFNFMFEKVKSATIDTKLETQMVSSNLIRIISVSWPNWDTKHKL